MPNAVDDALFARMRDFWSDDDIVEITGVIALFGFMNRWNDTMATPLEQGAGGSRWQVHWRGRDGRAASTSELRSAC